MLSIESTLASVTVYREGAVCVRQARVQVDADRAVRFIRLPLSLEPGSLRAQVVGDGAGVVVQDVRPQFDVVLAQEVDVPAEQKALEAAEEELARLGVLLARTEQEITELQALRPVTPKPRRGDPPKDAPVAAVLALADFADEQLRVRMERRAQLRRESEDARNAATHAKRRLQEASSARRTERAQLWRVAVVTLSKQPEAPVVLALEYQVPGARWAPSYTLRLAQAAQPAVLQLRANIAQQSGEDWTGVQLALSTASLSRRADAPELKALKIGRRQDAPPKSGWREPPPGLDALFEAHDAALQRAGLLAPPGLELGRSIGFGAASTGVRADLAEDVKKKGTRTGGAIPLAGGGPPPPPPRNAPAADRERSAKSAPMAPAMLAMPSPATSRMRKEEVLEDAPEADAFDDTTGESALPDFGEGGGGKDRPQEAGAVLGGALLDYARLVMPDPRGGGQRGRLAPAAAWDAAFVVGVNVQVDVVMAAVVRAQQDAGAVRALALPAQCAAVAPVNAFDYRYTADGVVDVPSTGSWTMVPVMACPVGLTPGYVCVPSVEAKVYRTMMVANRSPHALLRGPVDVTLGDAFLLTTMVPPIPPGADQQHRLGLGVEEAIKVARKTQYKETTGGLFAGATALVHDVEVELNNRLGTPATVEVLERVPFVPGTEKDLKVEESNVSPPWEKVETPLDGAVVRGARRWKVSLAPGSSTRLTAQFTIKMPADKMVVGGNRRG
jgi:hypothetical protein